MPVSMLPPSWLRQTFIPVLALALPSCQSYEPAPLDITQYQHTLSLRAIDVEPIEAFCQRLTAEGEDVPDAFDLSDGISYAEGEVIALFYNPELRIAILLGCGKIRCSDSMALKSYRRLPRSNSVSWAA